MKKRFLEMYIPIGIVAGIVVAFYYRMVSFVLNRALYFTYVRYPQHYPEKKNNSITHLIQFHLPFKGDEYERGISNHQWYTDSRYYQHNTQRLLRRTGIVNR